MPQSPDTAALATARSMTRREACRAPGDRIRDEIDR